MGNANKCPNIVKKSKDEVLSWKWCIQHIESLKSNFFFIKLISYFYFWILNKCPC